MNALAKVIPLPFVTPEEEQLPGHCGYSISERSRFDDAAREEALQQQLTEAMPEEVKAIQDALDAHHAEVEADARRAQEEADEKYDEENSRW